MANTESNKLIDDYLNGNLSSLDKEAFESQLSSDPNLKSELNHQSEIIEGIESFRKAELKTRLAAINLSPTILGIISQSAAIKTAVSVATVSIIGTGVYFYNKTSFPILQRVDAISEYAIKETLLPKAIDKIEFIQKAENSELPVKLSNAKFIEPIIVKEDLRKASTNNAIDFKVPLSPNTADNSIDPDTEELVENTNGLEKLADIGTFDKVDVENIIDKKYKFHYKYTSGRLYLYGKFDKSPYEIIEINARNDKRLFFFYQENYYRIEKNTSDVTAFEAIIDSDLIQELNIIKLKQ